MIAPKPALATYDRLGAADHDPHVAGLDERVQHSLELGHGVRIDEPLRFHHDHFGGAARRDLQVRHG